MCNFSIVSFVIYLPLILIFVSIHDIPSNLIFIMYLLYFTFFVFLFIYGFNTPYIWEANYKPMRLTRTNEWEFVYTFFAYIMCVDHCHRHFLIKFFYVISYIIFSVVIIMEGQWKTLLVCSIEFITKILYSHFPFIISI